MLRFRKLLLAVPAQQLEPPAGSTWSYAPCGAYRGWRRADRHPCWSSLVTYHCDQSKMVGMGSSSTMIVKEWTRSPHLHRRVNDYPESTTIFAPLCIAMMPSARPDAHTKTYVSVPSERASFRCMSMPGGRSQSTEISNYSLPSTAR